VTGGGTGPIPSTRVLRILLALIAALTVWLGLLQPGSSLPRSCPSAARRTRRPGR
jgi:hypothetical protein